VVVAILALDGDELLPLRIIFTGLFSGAMFDNRWRSVRIFGIASDAIDVRVDATMTVDAARLVAHERGNLGKGLD
jgi:hypothetical protein